jgi:hypothetical protein
VAKVMYEGSKMESKILTRHPYKRNGVNINKDKYNIVKRSIIESLRANKEMTFMELVKNVSWRLRGKFRGSIPWYVTTIKLDLEARKVLTRLSNSTPQRLKLVK